MLERLLRRIVHDVVRRGQHVRFLVRRRVVHHHVRQGRDVHGVVRGRQLHLHGGRVSSVKARFGIAVMLVASVASAQVDRDKARAAYEEGTRAYKRGDFSAAVVKYAEADAIAPSPVALQAALDAAVKADDAVLGAELLERARTRDVSGALATSVRSANEKLGHRAAKLTASCPSACTVTLDGAAFETGRARWVKSGSHAVVFSIDGRTDNQTIDLQPDSEKTIAPAAPTTTTTTPPPPPPPITVVEPQPQPRLFDEPYVPIVKRHHRGVSPALFWVSLVVTGAFTVTSVSTLVVTQVTHDQFVQKACATTASADCRSLASTGNATQAVGDTFLGLSIAAALWTVLAGAVIVRWHGPSVGGSAEGGTPPWRVGASVDAHGGTLFWRTVF